jgi:hypothetical protein
MASGRRELALACALTLAGAVAALLAGGRVAPATHAVGLVALAGVVAILAARGRLRIVVGAVLGLAGALAVVTPLLAGRAVAWAALTVAGGIAVVAGGLLTTVRGRSWPTLGSRYDGGAATRAYDGNTWVALDRGEDPTLDQ